MKVTLINKSDSTGGAAMVSMRLLEALREAGVEARMLVAENLHDSPFVERCASPVQIKRTFLLERLKIFRALGYQRENLFKIDTASDGLPLWRHPYVKEADVVCLNWVNQGLLSLSGIRKLQTLGKPIVWTMHDMWNMTGICHHAGECTNFQRECGDCPLLGVRAGSKDLSHSVWLKKRPIEETGKITFVAVSNWLAARARESSLLATAPLEVIPNAFPIGKFDDSGRPASPPRKVRIIMGAARLDDPIKGLPILVEATKILASRRREGREYELIVYGGMKNPDALAEVAIPLRQLGRLSSHEELRQAYREADIVVSTSLYETLPGTLVEGQAFGCIPVSFDRGGQGDIIEHRQTGYLARYSANLAEAGTAIADGIERVAEMIGPEIRERMYRSVAERFSSETIAQRYIALFKRLLAGRR